jgi:hypothetical protein
MFGQGRPSFAIALARAAVILCAWLSRESSAQSPAPAEPLQLRITWGDGEACRWTGRIMIDYGSLSGLKVLGSIPDAMASIWLENGQVRVATLFAHKRDSIELAAQPGANSKLLVELAAPDKSPGTRLEIPVADLPRHPYQVHLDDHGNVFAVQLVAQSGLTVVPAREELIFAPGEQCSFEISASLPNLQPGTALTIQTNLTGARSKEAVWTDSQRLPVPVDGHPKVVLNVPLPRDEGVYTVHVAATRPSGFERFWSASSRLAERSFQVVVLNPSPPSTTEAGRWDSVLEIDPTNPGWFDRLPKWTQFVRIPGMNHGALGSSRANMVDLPLGRFVELPPTTTSAGPHWQAYSLPLQAAGVPHMLEVEYNAETEQSVGISIVEPNADGTVSGRNRDAGVYVEGLGRSEAKDKRTYREVFWPRTQAPMLLITNLSSTTNTALFSHIRVYKRRTAKLSAGLGLNNPRERLVAAYLSHPTLVETVGATQVLDQIVAATGTRPDCVDDCETAYESATRLADYLRYAGYNSAVINIPKLERAAVSAKPAQANSPEVDHLELMFRVFDREGLSLLPAMDLASPIEELEPLRRTTDPRVSGLEWIGADERTWLEANGTHDGSATYYNLLEPRVQQAVLDRIQQVVQRYGQHRAFAGLTIQLSGNSYAQLPPLEWGVDDATIARFSRETQTPLPDVGPDRFARRATLLTSQYAETWRSWRSAQMSAFYSRVAACVRGNTDRRLLLTTEDALSDSQLAPRLRPNLRREITADDVSSVLRDVGVDRQALERVPGIVLCPTRYIEPKLPLPDGAVDSQLSTAFSRWKSSIPSATGAAVLYHPARHQRLPSFELANKPWRVSGEMELATQPLPDASSICQPYLEIVSNNDPAIILDGGEQLPLGQEDILAEVRSTIAQLPMAAEVNEVSKQPIIARTYTEAGQVTLLVMNRSPWRCNSRVLLDLPQAATLTPVSALSTDPPTALAAGRQTWSVSLGPYGMRAVRIPLKELKILNVEADLSDAAVAELASALADLNRRDLTAPHPYQGLVNPSFEPMAGRGPLSGWHVRPENAKVMAELSGTNPQDGKTCLHVQCDSASAAMESEPFRLPSTGQLAMTVFVRGQNLGPNTEMRLILTVDDDRSVFRRVATVSAAGMQHPNGEWGAPFAMLVNDIPLQSRGQIRIAFELTGPGEVWLDNVKLYDLLFPLNFYANAGAECIALTQQIHAAKAAYDAKQITECVNLLNGYWPSFIIANRPLLQTAVAESEPKDGAGALPPQPNQGQQPPPGISDRVKRLLPILR